MKKIKRLLARFLIMLIKDEISNVIANEYVKGSLLKEVIRSDINNIDKYRRGQ